MTPTKNDGKRKQISTRSRRPAGKSDGNKGPADQLQHSKLTVKYTFERTKEDIANLEKVRRSLKLSFFSKSYVTGSEIYRDLPLLYLDAVKTIDDQILQQDELTAKLQQLDELRAHICRISEICKEV